MNVIHHLPLGFFSLYLLCITWGNFSFSESNFLKAKNWLTSLLISFTVFNKVPWGNLPSWETFLASAKSSEFSLAFLSILLNLAMVRTLAFILLNLSVSYFFFSSLSSLMILPKSTSLLCLLIFILSLETSFCFVSK